MTLPESNPSNHPTSSRDEHDAATESRVEDLESALEDIANGDWQRYPFRERHGQTTVEDYARWVLDNAD